MSRRGTKWKESEFPACAHLSECRVEGLWIFRPEPLVSFRVSTSLGLTHNFQVDMLCRVAGSYPWTLERKRTWSHLIGETQQTWAVLLQVGTHLEGAVLARPKVLDNSDFGQTNTKPKGFLLLGVGVATWRSRFCCW